MNQAKIPLLTVMLEIAFSLAAIGLAEPAIHPIALNQIGHATDYSKRFTTGLLGAGSTFTLRHPAKTGILYQGRILTPAISTATPSKRTPPNWISSGVSSG